MKKLKAVRGAVFAANDANSIGNAVIRLMQTIIEVNKLSEKDVVAVVIGSTADLTAALPATLLRKSAIFKACPPLFSTAEPSVKGGREGVIRVMMLAYTSKARPVYLDEAAQLIK